MNRESAKFYQQTINTMTAFTKNRLSSTCYSRIIDWMQQLAAGESENGISEYLSPTNDIETLCNDATDDRQNQQSKIELFRELRANAPQGAHFAELNREWGGMDVEQNVLKDLT
jgi:hypothetical protein